jgi:hypothetical protein
VLAWWEHTCSRALGAGTLLFVEREFDLCISRTIETAGKMSGGDVAAARPDAGPREGVTDGGTLGA